MQILFVISLFILNALVVSNINQTIQNKNKAISLNKQMYSKVEIAEAASQMVRIAYDLGQVTLPCDQINASSREIAGLNSPFKLCWVGLDANNCFSSSEMGGHTICISSTQSLTYNNYLNKPSLLNFIADSAQARGGNPPPPQGGGGPGGGNPPGTPRTGNGNTYDPNDDINLENVRNYTRGVYAPLSNDIASNLAGYSNRDAVARVVLPTEINANTIGSNYVNCNRGHTECFTLTFCTNGGQVCNGKDRVSQTFAVRHY